MNRPSSSGILLLIFFSIISKWAGAREFCLETFFPERIYEAFGERGGKTLSREEAQSRAAEEIRAFGILIGEECYYARAHALALAQLDGNELAVSLEKGICGAQVFPHVLKLYSDIAILIAAKYLPIDEQRKVVEVAQNQFILRGTFLYSPNLSQQVEALVALFEAHPRYYFEKAKAAISAASYNHAINSNHLRRLKTVVAHVESFKWLLSDGPSVN